MNQLDVLTSTPFIQALGWSLLHFLWEGTLAFAILAVLLGLLRAQANARYLVCCAGMAMMMLMPVITFFVVLRTSGPAPTGPAIGPALLEVTSLDRWGRLTPVLPWLTMLWLLGVCALQLRLIIHWFRAQQLKGRGLCPAPTACERLVRELGVRLQIRRHVGIFESSCARAPMLIGWLRPVILMPASAVTGLSEEQLRAVIVHELAHVRRHDYLVNLVQAVFESLLFYHPAVWWLSDRMRTEREFCCDDVAVEVCGDALCYAQALSSLDAIRADTYQPALASTGGSLMNRISRLVGVRPHNAPRTGGWLTPLTLTCTLVAAGATMSFATTKEVPSHPVVASADNPVDRLNLVGILGEFESEHAKMVAVLHESGVDNATIVTMLRALDPNAEEMEWIERSIERERVIDARTQLAADEIAGEVAAGTLTPEAAREQLSLARAEARAWAFAEQSASQMHKKLDAYLAEKMEYLRAKLAAELEAGSISEAEAEQKLEYIRADLAAEMRAEAHDRIKAEAHEQFFKARMQDAHNEIEARLRSGDISEAEATELLEKAEYAAAKRWRKLIGKNVKDEKMALAQAHVVQLRNDIDAALAAGDISTEEARQKLAAVERKLAAWREERARESVAKHEDNLDALHDKLRHAIETGKMTPRKAEAILRKAQRELDDRAHAKLRAPKVTPPDAIKAKAAAKLRDLEHHLSQAVEAGHLTESEAKEKLLAAKQELAKWIEQEHVKWRDLEDRQRHMIELDRRAVEEVELEKRELHERMKRLAEKEAKEQGDG